jgi:translation initiation factor IF-1
VVKEKKTEVEGIVTEALPNTMFRVKLKDDRIVLCHLSGKMRKYYIKVMPGDRVTVEMGAYDDARGRIIYRSK